MQKNEAKDTGYTNLIAAVATIKTLLKWLLAIFVTVMALVGYNIRETQQIKVVVAGLVENVAGKIERCDLKIDGIADNQQEIKQDIRSLDQRVKTLEVGNGHQ